MIIENFSCIEMKRRGAERIYEETKNMTREEELEYWRVRTEELRELQRQMIEKKKGSMSTHDDPAGNGRHRMTLQERHDEKVSEYAQKFREDGYEVTIDPESDFLPKELNGFRPDILAIRAESQVMLEVISYPELVREPAIQKAAEIARKLPDWRFDLGMLATEPEKREATLMTPEAVQLRLKGAESTAQAGDLAGAYLLLWTIVEAWMRDELRRDDDSLRKHAPLRLIKEALSHGMLSKKEHDLLQKLADLRNEVAHGEMAETEIDDDFETIRHLIESMYFDRNYDAKHE